MGVHSTGTHGEHGLNMRGRGWRGRERGRGGKGEKEKEREQRGGGETKRGGGSNEIHDLNVAQ